MSEPVPIELQEIEKQKLKLILSLIDDGVIIVDTEGTIVYINSAAENLSGLTSSEVIGKPVQDTLTVFDHENSVIPADTYCPTGLVDIEGSVFRDGSVRLVDKLDKIKNVSLESRKLKGGSSIGVGCIIIIKDADVKTELEKMKVDFTSMAVHVLRTPMTVLRGYLTELLKGETVAKLNTQELESLKNAVAGASELNSLVEDLLHLSEIQQGSFRVYPTQINYEGLVASMVTAFEPTAKDKDITIIYNPPIYKFPLIRVDVERVKEVLSNILTNAIQYTAKGFIEVKLFKDEKVITTVISDTGKGIQKEKLGVIFTKFYREKDNPLAMDTGYGIGLFVCQKIIEAHKGKIWVESREGVGSSFYFTLPLNP